MAQVIRLDEPARAEAFRADPDAALRRMDEPVLLDEWQEAPEVLGAVKRAVDGDPRPGRFLLTGSVRARLDQQMWPATGRVVGLTMCGLTEREVDGLPGDPGANFIDKLCSGDADAFDMPADVPDLPGYLALDLGGGGEHVELAGALSRHLHGVAGEGAEVVEKLTEPAHFVAAVVALSGSLCECLWRSYGQCNRIVACRRGFAAARARVSPPAVSPAV